MMFLWLLPICVAGWMIGRLTDRDRPSPRYSTVWWVVVIVLAVVSLIGWGSSVANADETPPTPVIIVDCFDNNGDPVACAAATTSTTSTTVYVPTPADINDVPAEPVLISPSFTG